MNLTVEAIGRSRKPQMIDTHAHLHLAHYDADRDLVITRDLAMGLAAIIEVNISSRGWPGVKRLIEADPRLIGTVGIHAHEASQETPRDLAKLEKWLDHPQVVAIGETGIDTYRDYAPLQNQQALFEAHVNLARESARPLVIHCRSAFEEVFKILDSAGRGEVTGVFHCFGGGLPEAEEVLARGFYIGLGGNVTYSPQHWAPVIRELPLGSILLETDCPYLKPAPERRGRNEPAWVYRTADVIAEMLDISPENLELKTETNAANLFGSRIRDLLSPEGRSA